MSDFWNIAMDCISTTEEHDVQVPMGTHNIKILVQEDGCARKTL